jgi:hypothetical protein
MVSVSLTRLRPCVEINQPRSSKMAENMAEAARLLLRVNIETLNWPVYAIHHMRLCELFAAGLYSLEFSPMQGCYLNFTLAWSSANRRARY